MSNLFENNGAEFSPCGKRRYALWRKWDASLPNAMFIGLNPSTANADKDDPTIRRVKTIACNLGYGGIYMMNLYTFVTPYPSELERCIESFDMDDSWLQRIAVECKDIIFAWGSFEVFGRDKQVMAMFPHAKALHINKNGSPKHPLYCRADSQLIEYPKTILQQLKQNV